MTDKSKTHEDDDDIFMIDDVVSKSFFNRVTSLPGTFTGSLYKDFVGGAIGGAVSTTIFSPFFNVEERLKDMKMPAAGKAPMYSSVIDCFRQTIAKEGFEGLYEGLTVGTIGSAVTGLLLFGGYSLGRYFQERHRYDELNFVQNAAAGAVGGAFVTVIDAPNKNARRLVEETFSKEDALRRMRSEGKIKLMYRDLGPLLLENLFTYAIYFSTYVYMKKLIDGNKPNRESSSGAILLAGGCAGLSTQIISELIESIRRRSLTSSSAFRIPFYFYMTRSFFANAICFYSYESMLYLLS